MGAELFSMDFARSCCSKCSWSPWSFATMVHSRLVRWVSLGRLFGFKVFFFGLVLELGFYLVCFKGLV